jgi:hypothetical protein
MSREAAPSTGENTMVTLDRESSETWLEEDLDPLDWMLLAMKADPAAIDEQVDRNSAPLTERLAIQIGKEADMYSWLKVPTRHSNLRRLLRVKLIELFSERGMYCKFEKKVTDFERNLRQLTAQSSTSVASNKVAEDFFGLKLPPDEASDDQDELKLTKQVARFSTSKHAMEDAIMVGTA